MKNVAVHNELNEVLQIIRGREPDNDLIRLLVNMLDAGDIEKGEGEGVWIAAADTRFTTERFAEEDWIREAVAHWFLLRRIEFHIKTGNCLDVEWGIRGGYRIEAVTRDRMQNDLPWHFGGLPSAPEAPATARQNTATLSQLMKGRRSRLDFDPRPPAPKADSSLLLKLLVF